MRRPALIVRCAALLLAAASCSSDPAGPLDRSERRMLESAERRWTERGSTSYTYEVRLSCFCSPEMTIWNEVRVENGVPVSITPLEPLPSGASVTSPPQHWPTVTQLFAAIHDAASSSYIVNVTAQYDPELGYPREIVVTCQPTIADCGRTTNARNLRALP